MVKTMTGDALRGFVIRLRDGRGVSQDKLADAIGMPRRTYIAWETGEIKDLKAPPLLKILQELGVPSLWLERLVDKRYEDGARLADEVLSQVQVVEELTRPRTGPVDAAVLSRLLTLLEEGYPADEAARRARLGQ